MTQTALLMGLGLTLRQTGSAFNQLMPQAIRLFTQHLVELQYETYLQRS